MPAEDIPSGPTVVHRVKSKLGYTEMHANAPGFSEDELVAAEPGQKNWKGISIAIFVIALILSAVGVAVFMLTPPEEEEQSPGEPFTVKDILDPRFSPRRFNGSWISDDELVFRDGSGGLSVLSMETFHQTQLVSNTTFRRFNVVSYSLSPNRKFLLLKHNLRKRYQYSTFAQYTVYEIDTGLTWQVSSGNDDPLSSSEATATSPRPPLLLHAQWMASSSSLATPIVFVEDYSVFYVPDVGQNINKKKRVFPISKPEEVEPEVVIHGVPDWVYEEDILKSPQALWPSPDGTKLVYATFNDTPVEEIRWQVYDDDANEYPYPKVKTMRYPKAGSTNPIVTLWLVELGNLEDLRSSILRPPKILRDGDHYFSAVSFSPDSTRVAVNWMSRRQDVGIVALCQAPAWNCLESYREPVSGWSSLTHPVFFSSSSSDFLVQAPVTDGNFGAYSQLALVSPAQTRAHPLSMGHTEVLRILAWDEEEQLIYFMGIPEEHPGRRHLFTASSQWRPGVEPQAAECLTCHLELQLGDRNCGYNDVLLSPSLSRYVLDCMGPDLPATFLVSRDTTGSQNDSVAVLDAQEDLRMAVGDMALPRIVRFDIPVDHGSDEEDDGDLLGGMTSQPPKRVLKARLFLPTAYRPDLDHIKYPLIIHAYSGPGHQLVTEKWTVDFNTLSSSLMQFAVLEVDGSGSGGRGRQLLERVRGRLGRPEVDDQLAALRYVRRKFKWIDRRRTAVTGVSYGGYVATRMLMEDGSGGEEGEDEEMLQCGVAVSPVVDWRFYESAYSERYLGLPSENEVAYLKSSLLEHAKALRGKDLFLAHGMADRNVHFQHSMTLAKELVRNNVAFKQQVYPDEGHFLDGAKGHLYSSVVNFLKHCLQLELDWSPLQLQSSTLDSATSRSNKFA